MATNAQIKALLSSYKDGDVERFKTTALQIAAHEANKGHEKFAEEIKNIVGRFVKDDDKKIVSLSPQLLIQPRGELEGLFDASYPTIKLNSLVFEDKLKQRIDRIVEEYKNIRKLDDFGLKPRSKILMVGAPGTGKTMTASALAGQLSLPLFSIQLDRLLTKYMGETAGKLRLVFEHIRKVKGVYFFDEFDAIGGSRNLGNDVGEIRRILNTFLQFIEASRSDSLILAATNYSELLDKALFRRFDDVLVYDNPTKDLIIKTYEMYLYTLKDIKVDLKKIAEASMGLSYSDISNICANALKLQILRDEKITTNLLIDLVKDNIIGK